jgi:hypothetical protein
MQTNSAVKYSNSNNLGPAPAYVQRRRIVQPRLSQTGMRGGQKHMPGRLVRARHWRVVPCPVLLVRFC